jgi:hypothetical protein
MIKKNLTRRNILRGTGVALALPWLETLAPKSSHAQAGGAVKRYFSVYFPNGTTDDWWLPSGSGATWQLSPILSPLEPVKQYVTVLGGVGNYGPFGGHIEPSHGHNSASIWTGVKANGDGNNNNSISVDQVIANHLVEQNGGMLPTPLHSLQAGAATVWGSPDGIPEQHSHSASWASPTEPLYKIVSPQALFDRIVGDGLPTGGNTDTTPDPNAERRRVLKQSALDYVIENAETLHTQLSYSDKAKMDQFLESARALEVRAANAGVPGVALGCNAMARPTQNFDVGNTPGDYDRSAHLTLLTDLIVMAVQCDVTRVFSYMIDDARSEVVYDTVPQRDFTAPGAPIVQGSFCGNYHGAQHGSAQDFASITYFVVEKMSELAQKLMAIPEGDSNVLANTHITFMSGMHGSNHDGLNLPCALIGGGAGIKTNQFIDLGDVEAANMHLTIIRQFGSQLAQFGQPMGNYQYGQILPQILA